MSDEYANWKVFDDWSLPPTEGQFLPDWNSFDDMLSAFSGVLQDLYSQLKELLDKWDHLLKVEFGKDPTHRDWRQFRPLRLSREEDWSDWLAYLIECSDTGAFSCCLFREPSSNRSKYATPKKVKREVIQKEYRADVIVQWSNNTFTHIEVKVGDPNLAKTFSTSRVLRERYHQPQERWSDYILLLSRQIPDWEKITHDELSEALVCPVTWADVCVALRQGLQSDEKMLWKAFAYSMIGNIEQRLVGYPGYEHSGRSGEHMITSENMETKLWILQKGLEHE